MWPTLSALMRSSRAGFQVRDFFVYREQLLMMKSTAVFWSSIPGPLHFFRITVVISLFSSLNLPADALN
jgi:hypothetical protein